LICGLFWSLLALTSGVHAWFWADRPHENAGINEPSNPARLFGDAAMQMGFENETFCANLCCIQIHYLQITTTALYLRMVYRKRHRSTCATGYARNQVWTVIFCNAAAGWHVLLAL
jgi:hypothetical protein